MGGWPADEVSKSVKSMVKPADAQQSDRVQWDAVEAEAHRDAGQHWQRRNPSAVEQLVSGCDRHSVEYVR